MLPMVGSWEIEHLDNPSKWFALSRAYLDGSIRLCEDMISGGFARSFPNAQVVMGLCHHSVELFYKGVLHRAMGHPPDNSHNLFDLETDVKKIAPDVAAVFTCPFGLEPLPPGLDEGVIKKRVGNSQDQQFRYHLDRSGKPWEGIHGFMAENFLEVLRSCALQYDVISPPNSVATNGANPRYGR